MVSTLTAEGTCGGNSYCRDPQTDTRFYNSPPPQRRGPAPGRGVRLTIRGLSPDVSWQDLKDFGREGGAVIYADVNRAGEGLVAYSLLERP